MAAATEEAWLERQCRMLGARAGMVALQGAEGLDAVASWPAPEAAVALGDIVARAATECAGLFARLPADAARPAWAIAFPVRDADRLLAVAGVIVRAEEGAALSGVMRQFEWGTAGLHLLLALREHQEATARADALADSLGTLARMLSEATFDAAALALVTEVSTRFGADRVSYASVDDGVVRLRAVSHSGQFGRKMTLVRQIEAAMQEATDQRNPVAWPPRDGTERALVSRAAEALAVQGGGHVVSLPLVLTDEPVGVLTLETSLSRPPSVEALARMESLGTIAAAALQDKWYRARPLSAKAGIAMRDAARRLLGPRHATAKLGTLGLVGLAAFLAFGTAEYRLPAEATLASLSQQIIAAPFAGYVSAAPARAGDRVAEGDVILTLDDRDLQLDRLRVLGELARIEGQHQRAVAERDRARIGIHAAERDQYLAQLNLLNQQLERTRLRAPFNGLVVSGDLSQRLGGAVERGEVLYAIAPTDSYRVDLRVRESRIGDLNVGQRGVLVLSARPEHQLGFTVSRLTPRVVVADGRSYFVVEALLDGGATADLQPGMQGVGRIAVGEASHWRIWTRDLQEWVRLLVWSWWP